MPKVKLGNVVKGYVVKRETIEEVPHKKHPDQMVKVKRRVEVSRVYHAISAAETFLAMCKKAHPDWDVFIHEKTGVDGLTHQPT